MTRQELSASIASAHGITKKVALEIIDTTLESIGDALARREDVSLRGFGTFKPKLMAAKNGRNPATGAVIPVAAYYKPTFKPSPELRKKLNP